MKSVNVLLLGCSLVTLLGLGVLGCRGGEGDSCLADSDCKQELVCLQKQARVDGRDYTDKWGVCATDLDEDGIPSDGDFSGYVVDKRCGVQVAMDPVTGYELVKSEVIGSCDDNCAEVRNSDILSNFGCRAKDTCCPISDELRRAANDFTQCEELTTQPNTCAACFTGTPPAPTRCYFNFPEGYDVDANGCLRCRPYPDRIRCRVVAGEPDPCVGDARLPLPACSGSWACVAGFCKFTPKLFPTKDSGGANILYQLDSDGDGVGDACDNCPLVPNGIGCDNPDYVARCDANGDGVTDSQEMQWGGQMDADLDGWGDACDLCPNLANTDNQDPDGDGLANPCDPDDDGDGYCDPGQKDWTCRGVDNCQFVPNPDQKDLDQDGTGDLCDPDRDGDGIREDGDGSGVEGDNPCNPTTGPCCDAPPCPIESERFACKKCDDNCPTVKNPTQVDADNDGKGDACSTF